MRRLTLKQYQNELLKYFKYFNDSFIKEDITWWAYAGTLLGAIRDNKQIKWDDDIDMGMTNSEYYLKQNTISNIAKAKGFFLREKAEHIGLVCNKIISKEIVEVEYNGNYYKTHFFIDIFLYVGVKKKSNIRNIYWSIYNKVLFIFGFFWKPLPPFHIKKGKITKVNILIQILVWLSRFIIFPVLLLHLSESIRIKKCKYKDYYYLHCKESHLNDFFEYKLIDWKFENNSIKVQYNYNDILKIKFGSNYMDLPPTTKRVPSHIFNGEYEN